MMTYTASQIEFLVQPHRVPRSKPSWAPGDWIDLSSAVTSGTRRFDMNQGSWSISLKFDPQSEMIGIVDGTIREGDWASFGIYRNDGKYSRMLGIVQECRKSIIIHPLTRAKTQIWTITGHGWGRAFTTPVLNGSALQAKPEVKVPRQDGAVKDSEDIPQIPGMVTVDRWTEIRAEVWKKAFQIGTGGVGPAMKKLLQILMNDTWKNPKGEAIIDRVTWKRFGVPDIKGIPWRVIELTMAGSLLTPDSILRQIGNESYNEVFYDYDDNWNPAIVFRPRPYELFNKQGLAFLPDYFTVPQEALIRLDLSRSGVERFNYFRSNAALMSYQGIEILIDNADGQSPIIDRESVERYGLRPIMPTDDFFPPMDRATNFQSFYIKRIRQYYSWYFNNPDMIAGQVVMQGFWPEARVGNYITVPERAYWATDGAADTTSSFTGYCVAVDERFAVDPDSQAVTVNSAVSFIRGEPVSLPVKEPESWVNTAPLEPTSNLDADHVTEHITWFDMASKDTPARVPVPQELRRNVLAVANFVEHIMAVMGATSITVISGWRTEPHNSTVNGAKASQHLVGKAIDFALPGFTTAEIISAINQLRASGDIAEGWCYEKLTATPPFVHYDIRGYDVPTDSDV